MENKFGKESILNISTVEKEGASILEDVYYTAPLKVMNVFNSRKNILKVMVLSASAGIMAGDSQKININVGNNSELEIMSQSYEKIHKMKDGIAIRVSNIKVGKNALLIYNMLPTIPFKDSSFFNKVNIELEDSTSKIVYVDILSAGRVASGEVFEYSLYKNLVEIREARKLIYRDNCIYNPSEINMNTIGMYEGYTHCANVIICNIDITIERICDVRKLLEGNLEYIGGISRNAEEDIIIRILGFNSETLLQLVDNILLEFGIK